MSLFSWHSVDTPEGVDRLRAAWTDAPTENEELLSMLLEVAREQVLQWAPAPAEDEDYSVMAPAAYVLAQLNQAANLWNAGRLAAQADGAEGFRFTPRMIEKATLKMIRPDEGVPSFA